MATKSWPDDPPTIISAPGVMGGMPCVSGTRVPAETILACINAGESVFAIHAGYPYLPLGSIEAVVAWAEENDRPVALPVRRVPHAGFGRRRD